MFLLSVFIFLNKWDIQIMISISIVLQGILIVMGNRRKYWTNDKLRGFVWVVYVLADMLPTYALGVLSCRAGYIGDKSIDSSFDIVAFCAPLFLLHLGGPDTIISFSLDDNELWRRRSLSLIGQVGVAVYVIYRAWSKTAMNILAIPMFIPGIIKIFERIWALRNGSSDPNERFMEEYNERFMVEYGRFMEEYHFNSERLNARITWAAPFEGNLSLEALENVTISDATILQNAYIFFKTFKKLFTVLTLNIQDIANSQSFFGSRPYNEAFKVIEYELGLMYDVFYTKAFEFYSLKGWILRSISFSSTMIILLVFVIIIDKKAYSTPDQIVIYVVLGGAIILEIYAVLVLLNSDWTMLWLSTQKNAGANLLYNVISLIRVTRNKRWSNVMAQFNLIEFCLKARPAKCNVIQKLLCNYESLEKPQYQYSTDVPPSLKKLIFEQLLEKSQGATNFKACKDLCACRGDLVLNNACLDDINEEDCRILKDSVEVEFDQSILLWHIATSLCHTFVLDTNPNSVKDPNCEASKLLSNYLLYLLVMRPVMLPNRIDKIKFQDTCTELIQFLVESNTSGVEEAIKRLLRVNTEVYPERVVENRSKAVTFDGCRLATSLRSLEPEKMWELVSHVWVEMLCYAASSCQSNRHAQQLTQGGELLTHVWLLMGHLGMTERIQISKDNARDNLVVH